MTSTDPTPQLLPGISAQRWARASGVLIYFTIPGYVGFAVLRIFVGDNDDRLNQWLVPVVTYLGLTFALCWATIPLFNRRRKKENAAGYTTTWRGNPTLPQLDAVSGTVIRAAACLPVAIVAEFGILAAGYGMGGIVLRRRLAAVRLLAPNELVFTFSKSSGYTEALAEAVGQSIYG